MTSLRVWWAVSGSDVAWEWSPGDAVVRAGRLVREGRVLRFAGTEEWAPMWTSERTRAGLQALKDLTALFAEEANVVPGDVRIFWIAGERAVSWCRSTGALSRHEVSGARADPDVRMVRLAAEALTGEDAPAEGPAAEGPAAEGPAGTRRAQGTAGDLRTADARARATLGI